MLTSRQLDRVKQLFLEARGRSTVEQIRIVEGAAAEDPAVGAELRRLLAHDAENSAFLEGPVQIREADLAIGDREAHGQTGQDR